MPGKVTLTFEQLWYSVETNLDGKPAGPLDKLQKKTAQRDLLLGVKAHVSSGSVLAILGPSGAGKTTLLNMLTLEKKGGTPVGHIRLNGQPLTLTDYNERCAYVQQFDTLWASLTVRDHLQYAMELYQPSASPAERTAATDRLMKDVGLTESADTKAGNEFSRGLSSGLKRRLSIALALAKEPQVLFLDEPTTGVDSAAAVMMMGFLREIATSASIAVVCTIHQPPASVFAGFDNNLVLSMGRVAYFGKAAKMGEYFASIGQPCPEGMNLAEFALDLVNKDFTPVDGVTRILDAWDARNGQAYGTADAEIADASETGGRLDAAAKRASVASQIMVLTRRAAVVAAREPLAYLVRAIFNMGTVIFFGIIYIKTRDLVQEQVISKVYYTMFTIGFPLQYVLLYVAQMHFEWLSLQREVKDGMYHPVAAAIASWVINLPMSFVLALCSLIPFYIIVDVQWSSFMMAWFTYSLVYWSFEGLGQLLAVAPNVIMALFNFLNMYFATFLFCGMFIDPNNVVWPFRLFCYLMPLRWMLETYMYVIWTEEPDYSGVVVCTPGNSTPTGTTCDARGFYCPGSPDGAVCFGQSGAQILDSVSYQFSIFTSEDNTTRNLAIVFAFGAVCRLNYATAVAVLTKYAGGQEPAPPPTADSAKAAAPAAAKAKAAAPSSEPPLGARGEADMQAIAKSRDDATEGGGGAFAFSEIGYTVYPKTLTGKTLSPKTILSGASARVPQGEVLAIVGPSGAGKTTLLNTLTFVKGGGVPTGQLTLNGAPLTEPVFRQECIYVPREDKLWPTFTPRQHLALAYALYKPEMGAADRDKAVDALLNVTGMTSCQHTKAGGLVFQGLSGGQRRRLSLALALVKSPRVIILDEPTSGLDSAAAAAITKLLKGIATNSAASVVCTIHQPSASVFAGFDQVLVLSEGRVAFRGKTGAMAEFFTSIGKPLSKEANAAEAALDLVSKDMTSKDEVIKILDGWKAKADTRVDVDVAGELPAIVPRKKTSSPSTECGAALSIFRRQMVVALTDPLQYWFRFAAAPGMLVFFGIVYIESANQNQSQPIYRLFFLWWCCAVPVTLTMLLIIPLNHELRNAVHEMKSGMYRPLHYVVSTTVVQIPFLFMLAIVVHVVSFAFGGWPWEHFFTYVVQAGMSFLIFESLAQLLAVTIQSPVVAMLPFMGYWGSHILFCGLVFKGTDVIWPFRVFYYLLPLKYSFNSAAYDIYTDTTWDGALECVSGATVVTEQGVGLCDLKGFYCPNATSSLHCFGRTGAQVLETLHHSYESVNSDDERVFNFLILLAQIVVFKVFFAVALWRAVASSDSPRAVAGTSSRAQPVEVRTVA